MNINITVVREVQSEFETPLTLEQFKEQYAERGDIVSHFSKYIEPQQDWYLADTPRIPLGLPDWMRKNGFRSCDITSIVARTEITTQRRETETGEILKDRHPGSRMYVHYITAQAPRAGNIQMVANVMMSDKRRARITESTAIMFNGDEVTGAWVKIIKDGEYSWFKFKTVNQEYQRLPAGVVMATMNEELPYLTIGGEIRVYRELRRSLAPMYEYNLYANTPVERSEAETLLEKQVSQLNIQLSNLFKKYKYHYPVVPLGFWSIYAQMQELAKAATELDVNDFHGRADLSLACVELVKSEIKAMAEVFR